jgi:tetratricopeptide (TPR) repeat protein
VAWLLAVLFVFAAGIGPLASPGQEGGAADERSVLISSRKADRDAAPSAESGIDGESEEPLAPVAVATDQQPKLAAPREEQDPAAAERASDEEAAQSSPSAAAPAPSDSPSDDEEPTSAPEVETAKFNGVQPGTTTAEILRQTWGEPTQRTPGGSLAQLWTYDLDPFKSVRVDVNDDLVRSIQLELEKHVGPAQLARQLRLDRFRPATIRDASGIELGLVFPERGVVFSYAPNSPQPAISHVLLEPVSTQPFVMRAEEDLHGPYEQNLRDLGLATELDPQAARAWWQVAGIELATGRFTAAQEAADRAVEVDPINASYRLRWATCLAQLEKYEQAVTETRRIAEAADTPAHIRAQALVQLARLRSILPSGGQEVMQLYQQAIDVAGELSRSRETDVRRAAKAVLIEAHLGVAQEIAEGQWREKEKVVPQWLERASAFAEDAIRIEGAGQEVRLQVAIGALEALGSFPPSAGPTEWVREAQAAIDQLLAEHEDELWRGRVHWEAGQAYLHALRVEHARARPADALRYGQAALTHFRDGARLREASPLGEHLVGRLYFHLGAVHAIHHQDHEKAIVWYEKAAPLLVRATPQVPGADPRLHGDALVSMGVSYWDRGAHDRAIELTHRGAGVLQSAVQSGGLEEGALSVAYGNLANMHKRLGNEQEADRFIQIAESIQSTSRQ